MLRVYSVFSPLDYESAVVFFTLIGETQPGSARKILRTRLKKGNGRLGKEAMHVQRHVSKFLLQDYSLDYKIRLISLELLPISLWLELQDILFLVKCIKDPRQLQHTVKSAARGKLAFERSTTSQRHNYFNRIVHLWDTFPEIDLHNSFKKQLSQFLWNHFERNFDPDICTYTCVVHA